MVHSPRAPRPTALHHVTARGRAGRSIYLDDADRLAFLDILGNVCRRMRWACYAYCLMDNHYHLVLETTAPSTSSGIQQLNRLWARRFNRLHGRRGPVFQGSSLSGPVEGSAHLKELVRYVVLNPVRAKIVPHPECWPWSSYRTTIGDAPAPPWLARGRLLSRFGPTLHQAVASFIHFVHDRLGAWSLEAELREGSVLARRISHVKTTSTVVVAQSAARESFAPPYNRGTTRH